MFIETPSKVVSPPTNVPANKNEMGNSGIRSFTMYKRATTCCETYETTHRVSTSTTT